LNGEKDLQECKMKRESERKLLMKKKNRYCAMATLRVETGVS
jgi:hypothetical protein